MTVSVLLVLYLVSSDPQVLLLHELKIFDKIIFQRVARKANSVRDRKNVDGSRKHPGKLNFVLRKALIARLWTKSTLIICFPHIISFETVWTALCNHGTT